MFDDYILQEVLSDNFYLDGFFMGFSLPCHAFQTRHVCFPMHNSLNIACLVCNYSTMIAIQR